MSRFRANFSEDEFNANFNENEDLAANFDEGEALDASFDDADTFEASIEEDLELHAEFGEGQVIDTDNYDHLANKPIHQATTEFWNGQPDLIAKWNNLYFYIDRWIVDGKPVPGLKLGDGTSYLIDLPFMDLKFEEHLNDNVRHITQEERIFWNNKNRAEVSGEVLLLRKD